MTDQLIAWKDALAMIRERLHVSEGKSQALLKEACRSLEVRVSVDGMFRTFAFITEWAWSHGGMGAEGMRHLVGGGRPVKFSEADLRYWLDQRLQIDGTTLQAGAPGRKAGEPTLKGQMCEEALKILEGGDLLPAHGRLTKIAAQLRGRKQFLHYEADSIAGIIRHEVRNWERNNPGR